MYICICNAVTLRQVEACAVGLQTWNGAAA
jgi:bacterioferritin-associated ferredoxin